MKPNRLLSCGPSTYSSAQFGGFNRTRIQSQRRGDAVGQRWARQPGLGQSGPGGADADCSSRIRPRCNSSVQEESISEISTNGQSPVDSSRPPMSEEWEVDFCSRPLLDERGKKVWELLICNPDRSFEYSEYFPNNKINSAELRKTFETLISQDGAVAPLRAKFFRGQMKTIITRALTDLGINPVPSRRCFGVMGWLDERKESVYKKDPRYTEKAQTLFTLDLNAPEELPDPFRAEAWNFVQLPLHTLLNEMSEVEQGNYFGATLSLRSVGLGDVPEDALVPGIAVYSTRADPLAAWMNGLEIAAISADTDRACLILDAGVNERYIYGAYSRSEEATAEAQAWEMAKESARGLHFLAVQSDPDADISSGLWLLLQREAPGV